MSTQMSRRVRRYRVLQHYSSTSEPSCACCGESALEFLAIDHEEGNGNQHRQEIGKNVRIFDWIYANDFPEGFRVLCHNCNCAHGYYGYCPHQSGEQLRQVIEDWIGRPPGKGSRHGMAKLTEEDVRMIKKRREEGATYKELMDEFPVGKPTLSAIFTGRQWKHV